MKFFDFLKKDNSKNKKTKQIVKHSENKQIKISSTKETELNEYIQKIGKNGWVQGLEDLPTDYVLLTFDEIRGIKIPFELRKYFAVCGILGTNESSTSGKVIVLQTKNIQETTINNSLYDIVNKIKKHNFKIVKTFSAPEELLNVLYGKKINNPNNDEDDLETSEYKIKFLKYVTFAVQNKVSDIHFEVRSQNAKIRMRKLGEMYDYMPSMDPRMAEELIRCIYQVHTDEESRGQSFQKDIGQVSTINISQPINGKKIRIRYQSNPAYPDGFDVILRLLFIDLNDNTYEDLLELGYSESQKTEIEEIVAKPNGVLIIAGTTGSGKSTTLKNLLMYANELYQYKKKIYTIEDPPEYYIPNVTQIPVNRAKLDTIAKNFNEKEESHFARPIVDLMRSDPDIVMIGEIRDQQTADGIKKLTQSGHQVFSTTHTGSALGIVERLFDLKIEPSILGDYTFLTGLVYQKLLPIVCPHCSDYLSDLLASASASDKIIKISQKLKKINFSSKDFEKVRIRGSLLNNPNHRIKDCPHCNGSGLIGREVCAEIIKPDMKLYSYFRNRDAFNARLYWRSIGYHNKDESNMTGRTILEHAIYKVKQGKICPFDVESYLGSIDESYKSLKEYEANGFFDRESKISERFSVKNKITKKNNYVNNSEATISFEQDE